MSKKKQMNITLSEEKYNFLKRNGLYGIRCVDYTIRKYKEERASTREEELEEKIDKLKSQITEYKDGIASSELLLKEFEDELFKLKRIPETNVKAIEHEMDLLYCKFIESSVESSVDDTSLESFFDWKESDIAVIAMDYHVSIDEVKNIYEKFYYHTGIDDVMMVDQVVES